MLIEDIHGSYVATRRVSVLANQLAAIIPSNAALLDVGCGDGRIARQIAMRRNDISTEGVDVLKRESTEFEIRIFDGKKLPYDAGDKDVVMFIDVLHHTDDPMILLKEAARVSKRWILIKDHFRDGLAANSTLRVMDWLGNARFGVRLPYNYWSAEQWRSAFTQLSWQITKENRSLGLYPWWANWIFGRGLHFIALLEKVNTNN